ncbi:hypothetical protein GCM10020295_42600 [Streptomyces cinereospinus]
MLAVAAPLAGRERSLPGIVALLAAGQTVLHTLFGLGQHGTAAASAGGAAASDAALVAQAARLVCGTTAAALSPAQARRILVDARLYEGSGPGAHAAHPPADALSTAAGSAAALLPSLPMLLGHVLAAVAAGGCCAAATSPCCGSPNCRRSRSPRGSRRGRSCAPCARRSRWRARCGPGSPQRRTPARACGAHPRTRSPSFVPPHSSTR